MRITEDLLNRAANGEPRARRRDGLLASPISVLT
jgi:hypothetical protein